jgi:hypothetical protein
MIPRWRPRVLVALCLLVGLSSDAALVLPALFGRELKACGCPGPCTCAHDASDGTACARDRSSSTPTLERCDRKDELATTWHAEVAELFQILLPHPPTLPFEERSGIPESATPQTEKPPPRARA